ncbi:MAG: hypothetical protein Q4E62_07085 [Sutterellaceae bacterium]|nr:hypothetical protein [Sutterellaceae bacterium]
MNKDFFKTYFDLIKTTDISDALRVTQKEFDILIGLATENSDLVRYRKLGLHERTLQYIPDYWFYRAEAAYKLWEKEKTKKYADDIALCHERYQFFKDFLRVDPLEANIKMFKVTTGDLPKDEALTLIDEILSAYPSDGSKLLFAAVTALKYEEWDKAKYYLQLNLDMNQYEPTSRALLSGLLAQQNDSDNLTQLVEKLINDTSASNQEVLYLLSRFKLNDQYVQKFLPAIGDIRVFFQKGGILSNDRLTVGMPSRWMFDIDGKRKSYVTYHGKKFESDEVELSKDKKTILISFQKLAKSEDLFNQKTASMEMYIPTNYFPVTLKGDLSVIEKVVDEEESGALKSTFKSVMGKIPLVGSSKNETSKEETVKIQKSLRFKLDQICSGTSCLPIKNNMLMRKNATPQKTSVQEDPLREVSL